MFFSGGSAVHVMADEAPMQTTLSPFSLKRMSVEDLLSQEVITVGRRPQKWGSTPSSVYRSGWNAARVTGANTLPELLRLSPQLFVAQSSSSEWAINTRGFMRTNGYSNKLLVMIDGRTVYSPFFSNVFWDAQDIFMPDLDRAEVIAGPAGSNWGSNAVNGVINILTQSAFDTQQGILYAGIGTHEQNHVGVRQGGRFGDNGAWRVYAKRMEYGSTLAADGSDAAFDDWRYFKTGMRTDWRLDATSDLTVQGDVYLGRYNAGPFARREAEGANLLARWNRQLFDGGHIRVQAYHDYVFRDMHGLFTQETATTDIELQHSILPNHRHEILWGLSYREIEDSIDGMSRFGVDILPNHLDYRIGSAFLQHTARFADERAQLISGLRAEYNYFTDWEFLPSLKLVGHPTPQHTLWASVARATRIPDRLDRGFHIPAEPTFESPDGTPAYHTQGGAGFGSEVVWAWELGWRAQPASSLSITATLFYHDYHDLRSVEPGEYVYGSDGSIAQVVRPTLIANGVEGHSQGAELFVDWDALSWWRIRMGGFYTEQGTSMKSWSNDASGGQEEISYPRYQVQFRSTFQLQPSTTLWFALRRADEVPAYEDGQTGSVPAYTELDASLNWEARPGLEFSLTGRNLLNASHPEIGLDTTRREIRRSLVAMARWSY